MGFIVTGTCLTNLRATANIPKVTGLPSGSSPKEQIKKSNKKTNENKICSMNEIKPVRKHTFYEHGFTCACSLCGYEVEAKADFTKGGKLIKVCYPINYCPNCGAQIEKFVQYGD